MSYLCEALQGHHDTVALDSGRVELDDWLRRSARDSDGRNLTRTYVWHAGDGGVVAYFSVMPYVIERQSLGRRAARGLTDRIPCYLLARLALDRSLHGRGLGSQLLASALVRTATAARAVGGRFVVVDAIDGQAASFYRHHGFVAIPDDDRRLVLPVKALDGYDM